MQKWSFNVHGYNVKDKQALYSWIIQNKPNAITVLDNKDMASEIADLGVPNVILRVTPNDDRMHILVNHFSEWWRYAKSQYEDKRLKVYVFNEPQGHRDKVNQIALEGMDILAHESLQGVFGNFYVGGYESEEIRGVLRPMLQKLNTDYRDIHKLGLHEGWMYELEYAVPYLSGRYRQILELFPDIKIIFTEFGVDFIEDVWKRYPGEKIRGYKQHEEYWKTRGLDPSQHFIDSCKKLQDDYYQEDAIEGVCYFCYGDSGGWDLYNFETEPDVLNKMEQLEMETVITVGEQVIIKAATSDGTNRRTGAGTNFSKNGMVTTPVTVTRLQSLNGWTQYRFADGDFWVKDEFIVVMEAGSNITIRLYDATPAEVERVKELIEQMEELSRLFKKLRVEIE